MPRKLRLEFPGACYHVINRGNYRSDIFATAGAKAAFEACLFEASQKSAWVLHAFAVMRNHYHLAIETPQGNLVAGMQWLQATFANRFNRLRKESGHLFQGRYKAILVEAGEPLASVCHYIHLNPVRAGATSIERLSEYRYSSYWYLPRPKFRPSALKTDLFLANAGGLVDSEAGWNSYQCYLAGRAKQRSSETMTRSSLSKGWALGSAAFKAILVRDHALAALSRAWEKEGAREIHVQTWEELLTAALRTLGRSTTNLETKPKASTWKVATALFLKSRCQASNPWLAQRLRLGSAKYVSHLISVMRRAPIMPAEFLLLQSNPRSRPSTGNKTTWPHTTV